MLNMSQMTHASYEKEGWEFSFRDCASDIHRLEQAGMRLPSRYSQLECCIKHLDSGIKFRFRASDAIAKCEQEKICDDPLRSGFPSYASPLLPVVFVGFDCAYVGDVFTEKPGGQLQCCCSSWEDIDWKTLHEQIDWMTANETVSGPPNSGIFHVQKDSKIRDSDGQALQKKRKEAKKSASEVEKEKKEKKVEKYRKKGLTYQLVNHMERIYYDNSYPEVGYPSCYFNLVVTDCGWFASLRQLFQNYYGAERIREMTMHCNFNQNVIYREIIERQTKDFEESLSKFDKFKVSKKPGEIRDGEMCVRFHEAKQFNIQEAYMGGSSSCTVRDARRYSSFTVGEWKETSHGALDIPDDNIKSLFDNCGEKKQSIEAKTRTRIQIIPLFRHPYNPKISNRTMRLGKAPRAAYIHGSENDVENARSCLAEILAGTSQLCSTQREMETDAGPPSSDDVKCGALSDVPAMRDRERMLSRMSRPYWEE